MCPTSNLFYFLNGEGKTMHGCLDTEGGEISFLPVGTRPIPQWPAYTGGGVADTIYTYLVIFLINLWDIFVSTR